MKPKHPISAPSATSPVGKPLVYVNSLLNLAVALNQGNYAAAHKIDSGPGLVHRDRHAVNSWRGGRAEPARAANCVDCPQSVSSTLSRLAPKTLEHSRATPRSRLPPSLRHDAWPAAADNVASWLMCAAA